MSCSFRSIQKTANKLYIFLILPQNVKIVTKRYSTVHCFKCRFFRFCALESCSTQSAQFTSMYWIFISGHITVYLPYLFLPTHVLYISSGQFCTPKYCSVFAGIQMSLSVCGCIISSAFFNIFIIQCNGLVGRVSVSSAAGSCSNPMWCVLNIFSFTGFFLYITI